MTAGLITREHERKWWKEGVVYQIYPASYKDSNGDGLGDLPGILSKIDYIADLGIDIVWICPMYASPQHDMGYDISDYQAVHPPYGNVEDVEKIIEACHKRGMRLILDLVINHSSDEHAWFQESKSSKDNPKRDWYIWRPAKYTREGVRMPPNNWKSFFGGSVWEWDESTQEYYLHLYGKKQPDFNWENEETRKALFDNSMVFWLEKGVDGFRVDCANQVSKFTDFPDVPIVLDSFEQPSAFATVNGPRIHEFTREMVSVLDNYDSMTVGELPFTYDPEHILRYVSASQKQLSMVLRFDFVDLGHGEALKYEFTPWKISQAKKILEDLQTFIEGTDGWTTAFCENHDQGRSVSRYASDTPQWRERSAKMLAILMSTMTGTLFVYQGQEIGMINAPIEWSIEEYRDIECINYFNQMTKGNPDLVKHTMKGLQILARDHSRFPMQWDDSPYAGFSTKNPWMRVHPSYKKINVASDAKNPHSVLNFWRKMLQIRKKYKDLFVYGTFQGHDMDNEKTFVFGKAGNKAIVVLNFTDSEQKFDFPVLGDWEMLVGNVEGADPKNTRLQGYEGRIYLRT